jgi:hypothetical protein
VRSFTTSYGLFDVSKRVLVNNDSDEFPFMEATQEPAGVLLLRN